MPNVSDILDTQNDYHAMPLGSAIHGPIPNHASHEGVFVHVEPGTWRGPDGGYYHEKNLVGLFHEVIKVGD